MLGILSEDLMKRKESLPALLHTWGWASEVRAPSTVCTVEMFPSVQKNNQTDCVEQSGGHNGDAPADYTRTQPRLWDVCLKQLRANKSPHWWSTFPCGLFFIQGDDFQFPADSRENVSFFEYLRVDDNFPLFGLHHTNRRTKRGEKGKGENRL